MVIINDILGISKIESGKLSLESCWISNPVFLDRVMALFGGGHNAKGLVLSSRIAEDVPPCCAETRNRLQQVLSNLLANAIKFQ